MLHQDKSDETLVMLTLAGEQRAYETLVVRHEKAVVAAARAVTGSQFMAQDAAQDAFVTAWLKLNTLHEADKYCAWVCRIAKNCAKNMLVRYHGYLDLGDYENHIFDETVTAAFDPQTLYESKDERKTLNKSVDRLPDKIREIIRLHYFEGLSIADIADRMRVSAGTVKWQLHEGRKRIRKDLCSMNEELNDTLVRRVMKKIEELKLLWKPKNSKNGFEASYKEILQQIEELPESGGKFHAMADVLMLGWWWLPGKKNEELFARICHAAEMGKNDDVMRFIATREDTKFYGSARIDFIRDKQIPRLEKAGYVKALGSEWFWLGRAYFEEKEAEKGMQAYKKALMILPESDIYHSLAQAAIETEKYYFEKYVQNERKSIDHIVTIEAGEYSITPDGLCHTDEKWCCKGELFRGYIESVLINASGCDGMFAVATLPVGGAYTGSDGTTLRFADDNASVVTPAGRFDGCQVWVTEKDGKVCTTYFKEGVGIVKHEKTDDVVNVLMLKSWHIEGGSGLFPCHEGNVWEYTGDYSEDVMLISERLSVRYADGEKVIFSCTTEIERLKYDDNSWADMMLQIRNELFSDEKVHDMSYQIERAEALASTPLQKAHTVSACSVARRIYACHRDDADAPEDTTDSGHWNFFQIFRVNNRDGDFKLTDNRQWAFELKNTWGGSSLRPLYYNDIYGLLKDSAGALWSDRWTVGADYASEGLLFDEYCVIKKTRCEKSDGISVKAGVFDDCIKLSVDMEFSEPGGEHLGGKKEYYFARGVGIVRVVNYLPDGCGTAVYELTSYEGTGDGYMPLCSGLVRRYDALDLLNGYYAGVEYRYASDDSGRLFIFSDQWGCRKKNTLRLTDYSEIYGEKLEEELWEQKKHDESRLRHAVNNINLLQHYLGRNSRTWAKPKMSAEWKKYVLRIIEMQGDGGEPPRAWWGVYSDLVFSTSVSLFGCGEKEEGYEYLDRAFELFEKWFSIPDGELLEFGSSFMYGDIKLVKGYGCIELPDGSREAFEDRWYFESFPGRMYYGMTAKHGWEWFNGVRDEDRFKEAIRRAEELQRKYLSQM